MKEFLDAEEQRFLQGQPSETPVGFIFEAVRKVAEDMAAEYPRWVRWSASSELARLLWHREKPMRKKLARLARTTNKPRVQ